VTKEIVVFGGGDIAQLADFYFSQDSPYRVAAFTVDAAFRQADTLLDRPLIAFEELARHYPPNRYRFFVALS